MGKVSAGIQAFRFWDVWFGGLLAWRCLDSTDASTQVRRSRTSYPPTFNEAAQQHNPPCQLESDDEKRHSSTEDGLGLTGDVVPNHQLSSYAAKRQAALGNGSQWRFWYPGCGQVRSIRMTSPRLDAERGVRGS